MHPLCVLEALRPHPQHSLYLSPQRTELCHVPRITHRPLPLPVVQLSHDPHTARCPAPPLRCTTHTSSSPTPRRLMQLRLSGIAPRTLERRLRPTHVPLMLRETRLILDMLRIHQITYRIVDGLDLRLPHRLRLRLAPTEETHRSVPFSDCLTPP